MLVRSATNKPMTSAPNITNELLSSCNVSMSVQTVRNIPHSTGLKARTSRKKPYISEINRIRRLELVRKCKNKPMDFWKKVIFSDEGRFEIFTPPSIREIWRKNKTLLELKNKLPTLKHGGVNVMVCGCVARNGASNSALIDSKMNALAYIDVLQHNVLDSDKKLSMEKTFIFQPDNGLKHTAIVIKTWVFYHAPRRLETPTQSPDFNPIENLWMHLDTEVREKNVTSKDNLKEKLQKVWNSSNIEITKKLIESMPRRFEAVIKANGLFTKYWNFITLLHMFC
ncbi:transposable element Tcb2 transposase [Trichonephila clavipes]|uniref:Transposable element Tcb2 transposase n=1 Tax=Trichonephila clavipes TaxID=2585209 RepID=A0A8X6STD0_TRICX|nr:transposable element Tcb2 transposase [Trichonephila clavipes]